MREDVETGTSRIPVAGPWITEKELAYVQEAVRDGWYENANAFTSRFEEAFAAYVGVRHAVSLPSATAAIHLSLVALGVGPGDEVIVPDSTWIATAAPVSYVGATPIFADVDPLTWCLDAGAFESCITPRSKAVIPVDLYGSVPDWDPIRTVADAHGIAVIEDAAQAIGSEYKGGRAGSFGDTGVFSFHGSKTLTTGEGGMLVTDRGALHERILVLRDHGRQPGDTLFRNVEVAFKYKMSGLQAALGLAQLERVEELVERKREIFSWYQQELAGLADVAWNAEPESSRNSHWMVTAVAGASHGASKESIIADLSSHGIDSRPFFYPLSSLDAYRDVPTSMDARARNLTSYRLSATGVNLPSALRLSEADAVRAARAYAAAIGAG